MTLNFVASQAIARATATACACVRALGAGASTAMRKVVVASSRSPAQGLPALR